MHGSLNVANADQAATVAAAAGSSAGSALDPRKLFGLAVRRWRVVLLVTTVVFGLVMVGLLQITPIYSASATILLEPRKEKFLSGEMILAEYTGDAASINTEISLILSYTIARRVAERLRLDEHPQFGGALPQRSFLGWARDFVLSWIPGRQAKQDPKSDGAEPKRAEGQTSAALMRAIGGLQRSISAVRSGATNFIVVSYSHTDPKVAADVVNAYGDAYVVEQLEARFQATKRASEWMNDRLNVLRQQVAASEAAVVEHRARNNLVNPAAGTIAEQQAGAINAQLVGARAQTVEKRSRYEQVRRAVESGGSIETISGADSGGLNNLRQQEAAIARQEADLLSRYGSEHPQMVKIRAERADIRRQMAREVTRYVQTLKSDYEFALKREEALSVGIKELTGHYDPNDELLLRARQLEREAETNKSIYDALFQRSKQAEQQSALPPPEARVVSPAFPPASPSYPDKRRFILLGLLGGLVLGAGAAFLLENLESGFVTVEQAEQFLSMPVLSVVQQLPDRERNLQGKPVPIHEFVVHKPLSRFGESIRSARVQTLMSNVDDPPRMIQVTSAAPSEGKTTVALSLAYSAAASNQRVLMMDCDLRHPSTSKILNLGDRPGLTDLLLGQASGDKVFVQGMLPTLTILPAGTTTRNPPDLIGSDRLRQLLQKLREVYDLIIVDTPPITPVIDSVMLSRLVDKTIFVVRWRAAPRDIVLRALRSIDNSQHKVAGIILNGGDLKLMSNYAYYGYGYGYYNKAYSKYYSD